MSAGKLIIQEASGGLRIDGITEYDKGVELLVGTGSVDKPIEMDVKEAAEQLPAAVRLSVSAGEQVMDGLIRFTQPIFIKGATLQPKISRRVGKSVDEKIEPPKNVPNQSISALAAQMPQPGGAAKGAAYTLDDSAFRALAHILDDLGDVEHIKSAAHPFHDHLVDSIEAAKVDGRQFGFTLPVKVAFRDDATRDLFLGWYGQVQKKKKAAVELSELVKAAAAGETTNIEALAGILAGAGVVKSPLAALAV